MNKLQNPVVVGILVFMVVYGYLKWEVDRRQEEDPETEQPPINILIPGVAAALSWFFMASQMDSGFGQNVMSVENPGVPYCMQSMVQSPVNLSSVELLQRRTVRLPRADDVFTNIFPQSH